MQIIKPLIILLLAAYITACSTSDKEANDPTRGWSAEKLYNTAKGHLNSNEFVTAVEYFETLEARYPFGDYTEQAQLDIAYAYFKQDEYDNAIASADRFIKLHPRSQSVDYAYYIKGLANFSHGGSAMERLFPRKIQKSDQNWLKAAYANFDTLIRRYPQSQYNPDARQRMIYLRNKMAQHELETAEYYFHRGAMVAAINRATYLLEHYDSTPHTDDALAVMAKAYKAMGKQQMADQTLAVLRNNNPDHDALKKEKRSILSPLLNN